MSISSQAVESLALQACENVDHGDGEPVPSAEGGIPDLLTPISHSGVIFDLFGNKEKEIMN